MAMLVSSFATPTSWAEVAASAEASLAQRELQKAATSTEKIVPEDFPRPPRLPPSSVPDNDLGPGQYTCTESLIRRTVSCARFGKAERFRKEREENVANSIANWADQLGSSLSAPRKSHPDSEAPFALSADDMAARREFLRQSRSRLRQSSQKRSHLSSQISRACLADMGNEAIIGAPLGGAAEDSDAQHLRTLPLHHSGSLVRGNPRKHLPSLVPQVSAMIANSKPLRVIGKSPPGSPRKVARLKAVR